MRRLFKLFHYLAVLLAAVVISPASASIVIDQNFTTTDDPDNGTGLGIVTTSLAQTFTVGLDGKLAAVEFNVLQMTATNGDLTVDIRPLVGSAPDPDASDALASVVVPNGDIGTYGPSPYSWTSLFVDFSAFGIAVSAGDMLAFVLSSPLTEEFGVQTDYTSAYGGGSRWSQDGDGTAFSELATADLAFKTYVNVDSPATFALLSLGLAGISFKCRQKKAA